MTYKPYDDFEGHFMRLEEIRELIPQFKEYYYQRKIEIPTTRATAIIKDFNKLISPTKFHPYTRQYFLWRRRWDADILTKLTPEAAATLVVPEVKAVKTRDENNALLAPSHEDLESGAKNLGGELLNDALTMIKGDQQNEDFYDDEVLIKRRNYALNVFNFVMRAVNQKEALVIKRAQEKRETASFLMDLVRRSTAGKITPDEITLMESSIKQDVPHLAINN